MFSFRYIETTFSLSLFYGCKMLFLFGFLISCYVEENQSTSSCSDVSDAKQKASCITNKCNELSGMKKDECYHENIKKLSGNEMTLVLELAKQIEDTMIQGTAISTWVKNNNTNLNQQQGRQLCELLQGRDRFYCMRRLSSPHLKR